MKSDEELPENILAAIGDAMRVPNSTTFTVLKRAIIEAIEAAKPQPAAPEVVADEVKRLVAILKSAADRLSLGKRDSALLEIRRAIAQFSDTPPPAPQGDVAEAVAKERKRCDDIVCREWQDFAKTKGVGVSALVACILNAIRSDPAMPLPARAEQKADRAVASGRAE